MKLITTLIILLIPLVGICQMVFPSEEEQKEMIKNKYKMVCVEMDNGYQFSTVRCENFEVICYISGESMQCKFK